MLVATRQTIQPGLPVAPLGFSVCFCLSLLIALCLFLCRAATTRDTRWWSTRWSTTFTCSPAASSTPRPPPSLVCNAETLLHYTEAHTHTDSRSKAVFPRYFLDELIDSFQPAGARHRQPQFCYSECDRLDSEPDCRLHHIHSSAVTSLANGVLLFLSGSPHTHICTLTCAVV